ncbi:hypothetical protein D1632_12555 [Chryseobacterium nematophagum]|uniref:Uncharacterized protein n=1 Tax=Chryseobacterium nematophagum TaxID=2305228 RepID=A0A3M7L8V1_9FLAO|nr:hypothetical protein [Chryseobacterium nematophagum]RMZ58445.1 hypothetical protein D1632_12555 [Chryseobacterium nematophagum]
MKNKLLISSITLGVLTIVTMLSCNNERNEGDVLFESPSSSVQQTSRGNEYGSYSISHPSLYTNIDLPPVVIRVDGRSPFEGTSYDGTYNPGIFNYGFNSRGGDYSLTNHVLGGNNNNNNNNNDGSAYVATTSSPTAAFNILASVTGNMLLHEINRRGVTMQNSGRIVIRAYMYQIRPTISNFYSVVDNLPVGERYDNYRGQNEWVAVDQILPNQIQSVAIYEDTFVNGVREGVIRPVGMEQNNNYVQSGTGYYSYYFPTHDIGITRRSQGYNCQRCEL